MKNRFKQKRFKFFTQRNLVLLIIYTLLVIAMVYLGPCEAKNNQVNMRSASHENIQISIIA